MDYWNADGAGCALLKTIGAGILGGVSSWEGALKGAASAATSAPLTPAIADLVKGIPGMSSILLENMISDFKSSNNKK
ncbi:hypothetical protein FHT85_005219 [Rhizobium sp. BK312]|uniref:hypothetical protein n=1 Tax=Rhizobium sp. BK312 TaxID=2587080 RepID=UPI000DD77E4C|nr:hypothetical protein [Rhizobium sp. BK312]MBB3428198.1 hypothetical protein [Rhizobium sp. BK312]